MLSSPLSTAKKMLLVQEGLRLKPYRDTAGKLTIGVGRNLDDDGISESEAMNMLANDIMIAYRALTDNLPWFLHLDDVRQLALLSMAFNLGIEGLLEFGMMLSYLHTGNYMQAAVEAMNSKWARQVPRRADQINHMILTGEIPDEFK